MMGRASSPPASDGAAIPNAVIGDLVRYVRDRAGIVLREHQEETLRGSLAEACAHFKSPSAAAFVKRLHALPADAPEREFLISRITIGESYFFRDEHQIAFLRDTWLPRIIATKRNKGELSLRIWCAGCSDGQEPYTVSMLLHEGIRDLDGWDVSILATDINADALHTATVARYSKWSFRTTSDAVRDQYFDRAGNHFVLKQKYRRPVSFEYLNLIDDGFPSLLNHTAHLDLILCRNVFIYFDRPTIAKVVKKFTACLVDGGHLLVGASDPVDLESEGLRYHHSAQTGYFVRADIDEPVPIERRPISPRHRVPVPRPVARPVPVFPKKSVGAPTPAAAPKPAPPAATDSVAASDASAAKRLAASADWQGALDEILRIEGEAPLSVDQRRIKARALANIGYLDEALDECAALIEQNSTDKHSYFLLGLVLLDRSDVKAAEKAFRRALFLDRSFVEAHHQLALTLVRAGNAKGGVKSLRNALSLAEQAPGDQIVHDSGGMTMDRLADVLRQSIDMQAED